MPDPPRVNRFKRLEENGLAPGDSRSVTISVNGLLSGDLFVREPELVPAERRQHDPLPVEAQGTARGAARVARFLAMSGMSRATADIAAKPPVKRQPKGERACP